MSGDTQQNIDISVGVPAGLKIQSLSHGKVFRGVKYNEN